MIKRLIRKFIIWRYGTVLRAELETIEVFCATEKALELEDRWQLTENLSFEELRCRVMGQN